MKQVSFRTAGIALAAGVALTVLLLPAAKSQMRVSPSLVPIGVSASGSNSTAWFHEPSTGRALACQTVSSAATGLSGIQCVATRLPQEGS